MPRLPTLERRVPRATRGVQNFQAAGAGISRAANIQSQEAGQVGTGLMRLAQNLGAAGDAFERIGELRVKRELAEADAAWTKGLLGLAEKYQDDQKFDTLNERYATDLGKLQEGIGGALSSRAREAFERAASIDSLKAQAGMSRRVQVASMDAERASLDDTLAAVRRKYLEAGDDVQREQARNAANAAITLTQERGAIDREAAGDLRRGFVEGVLTGRVAMMTDEVAIAFLSSDQHGAQLLDPAKRSVLLQQAQAREIVNIERDERAAEKALGQERAFRSAELTDGILEGRTTDADLDAALASRTVSGAQFIALRKLLKAQDKDSAAVDDPHVVLALTQQLEDGTLTVDQVMDAYSDRQIMQSTMNRLRGEIDAGPDDFQIKEQRRMLRENVGGVSGLGAILGEDATRKVNQASQEFNERTRGPDAEDPLKVRLDIESRAAEPRSLETLFRPRFMVGLDKETMDVRETRKATAKALRDGAITQDQAARELQLIKEIEAARARE